MEEEDEDWDVATDSGVCKVSRGIPLNSPVQVLIRVYIVSVRACLDEPRSTVVKILASSDPSRGRSCCATPETQVLLVQ